MINGKIQGSSGYEEIKLAVFYQIVSVEADRFQGCRFILLLFFLRRKCSGVQRGWTSSMQIFSK